jgi:peptidyl-prolyl cis-trans isomerase SurA
LSERIALLTILNDMPAGGMNRKQALKSLIDEQLKIAEATKYGMMPNDADLNRRISDLAKGMKLTPKTLTAKLKQKGVGQDAFKRYISMLIGFNRLVSGKFSGEVRTTDAEVDAKMAEIKSKVNSEMSKIMNDPRMRPVTVFSLMEINLPVESDDPMLTQARAVEATQVIEQFKGCGNPRAAARGVFNVKIGKRFDADAARLPKEMRSALERVGAGRAIGPLRSKEGIQVLAFCGSRKETPPKPDFKMPTRQQVERLLINEKYDKIEEDYLKTVRGSIYVEYRNPAYAQQ